MVVYNINMARTGEFFGGDQIYNNKNNNSKNNFKVFEGKGYKL